MPMPPPQKYKKGEIEYTSNIDRTLYSLDELSRAALREAGKYIAHLYRRAFYGKYRRRKYTASGKFGVSRNTQYWVRKKETDLQVGIKPPGFYAGFFELGTKKAHKTGLLFKVVNDNIPQIVELMSKYLKYLENETDAASVIDESEALGGDNDE